MSITPIQRKISDIIECFENGKANAYGGLVSIKGDTGGLSGGELMASLSSGNLGKLCRLYQQNGGTKIPEGLIQLAEAKDPSLNTSAEFRAAWKEAAKDPLMWETQDEFFYQNFELPGEHWCKTYGFVTPLSIAVVMDSNIHGGFAVVMKRVKLPVMEEKAWITEYIKQRRDWLANHKNPALHTTVYRMDTFLELVQKDNWNLEGPINVHVGNSVVVVN